MRKLLIASHNQSKIHDFFEIMKDFSFELTDLAELGINQEVEEDGETFSENSLKKAKIYAHLSGLLTLADDGGLEIPALDNAPGVRTRRWESNRPLTDQELVEKILMKMDGLTGDQRLAYLKTVITIYDPKTNEYLQTEGAVEGKIVTEMPDKISVGYPVRSIFYLPEFDKTYDQLTKLERDKINHRRKAIANIKSQLVKFI